MFLAALASMVAAVLLAWAPASASAVPTVPSPAPAVKVQYLAGPTVEQKFPSGNVYCTATYTKRRCLDAPTVTIVSSCFEGAGMADFTFDNPNTTGAPIDIAVSFGDSEVFGTTYLVAPGVTNPFRYSGFPAGSTVRIVVGWDDQSLTFKVAEFVVCG